MRIWTFFKDLAIDKGCKMSKNKSIDMNALVCNNISLFFNC